MTTTKGDLTAATITNISSKEVVHCMFNPHEYTLSKQNQYQPDPVKGKNVPKTKYKQGGGQTLRLQLFFDTFAEGTDVRNHTEGLWRMMLTTEQKKNQTTNKSQPPHVAFEWGQFYFKAIISSLSQKFTLFSDKGVPLRTTVDVAFQQVEDEEDVPKGNPTSGDGAAMKTHIVRGSDRLDLIAAEVYGNPTYWRLIARENGLFHPLRLRQGQQLIIPPLE